MSIPDIFATYGEDYFRDLETQITLEISSMSGVIISCGGGVIKRDRNKSALKLNGTIIFIDRPLDKLVADSICGAGHSRVIKLTSTLYLFG